MSVALFYNSERCLSRFVLCCKRGACFDCECNKLHSLFYIMQSISVEACSAFILVLGMLSLYFWSRTPAHSPAYIAVRSTRHWCFCLKPAFQWMAMPNCREGNQQMPESWITQIKMLFSYLGWDNMGWRGCVADWIEHQNKGGDSLIFGGKAWQLLTFLGSGLLLKTA